VAYWLTTGSLVFEEKGAGAMMLAHLQKMPVPPSQKCEAAISASLERAIMACLAKDPAQRPANAEALARMLDSCDDVDSWTEEKAEQWWRVNMEGVPMQVESMAPTIDAGLNEMPTL
jgi:serine/threonine-protein kinase